MQSQQPESSTNNSLDKTIKVQDRQQIQNFKESSEEGQDNFVQYDEELDNILQQREDKVSRQDIILQFKNAQLQKICQTLTSANRKLLEKVQQLQSELQSKNASEVNQTTMSQQYSEMNVQFTDVETMITQYRQQLTQYEQKIAKEFQQKNKKIYDLQTSLEQAKQALSDMNILNQQLQSQIQALQIQDISTKNQNDSRYNTPIQQYRSYANGNNAYYQQNYDYGSSFNSTVQSQLQKLIEKLVKQLEYERGVKRKITQQMKRMREDLIQSQKEIAAKNQRIYILEMGNLKTSEKLISPKSNLYSKISQSPIQQKLENSRSQVKLNKQAQSQYNSNSRIEIMKERATRNQASRLNIIQNPASTKNSNLIIVEKKQSQKQRQKQPISLKNRVLSKNVTNLLDTDNSSKPLQQGKQKKIMKSFSLLDLVNEEVTLAIVDKFVISIKLVDFFYRKIKNKDYALLMLQDILICNYNKINTNLILIRKNTKIDNQKSKNKILKNNSETDESILWNLGFILDNFLIQESKPEQNFGDTKTQTQMIHQITNLIQDCNINIQAIARLKELFELGVKQRESIK